MSRIPSFGAHAALAALLLVTSCAGPAKLAERSEDQLVAGDHWKAWNTAIRALDKAPANDRARAAARAASASISSDWQRRITAVAAEDSIAAAEQVLELASFRAGAARYVTVEVSPEWGRTEQRLRNSAARSLYQRAAASNAAKRPKRAWQEWLEAERFVQPYRDAAALAEKARQKALTRVAIVPFACDDPTLGRDVATAWRDEIGQRMAPPTASFTRILGAEAVESAVSLAQLGRLTRAEAIRAGRDAGADRVVWGSVGDIESSTRLEIFKDRVSRRIVQKDTDGTRRVFWIDVPIEVVARTRVVTVKVDCEVVSARGGASLAHRVIERSTSARVVWTSHSPEGDIDSYALVSDEVRTADPARAKQAESRWKAVCGSETTLQQVLSARRTTRGSGQYDRGALPRFIEGAAFVMLSELPPANDLALAALTNGWQPLHVELSRLDAVDDVDLGLPAASAGTR